MNVIISGIYIFLELLKVLIFIDIILSLFLIFGINLRPKFLVDIIDTIYNFIKSYIPTNLGFFDFTPIIVIFIINILKGILIYLFPYLKETISLYNLF